ncbi:MAG: endonuclease/exonuclease/phosphatase family protein [Shimia sp.]
MRIATYNVEWFDALFNDDGGLRWDDGRSGRHGVTRTDQLAALGRVFQAIDADAVMVIEAPDTGSVRRSARALEAFAAHFALRARRALGGFANGTQQEITLMYDPDVVAARHDPRASKTAPLFDAELLIDLDVDAEPEVVRWSKPPLELALEGQGRPLRMIGVHAKSKAPHGARSEDEARRISIANRRKQLAQCIWLRRRVEAHLAAGDDLIVLGDFNDGPGLDEYEALFGRSGVEIVLGAGSAALFDPHAAQALGNRFALPTTARFWLEREGRYLQALLDYIMVSPGLRAGALWRIWHPFDDPECFRDADLRDALLAASDHFPVTLDLPD